MVPMPSSRRATAACRIAGWKAAEKQKVMPASAATSATRRGRQVEPDAELLQHVGRSRLRGRRAVAVLDDPRPGAGRHDGGHGRDVDRHRAVAAGADDVEQPALDRDRGRAGVAWRPTRPLTSAIVSPLARSATAKPAICTGVASPASSSPIAHAVWSADRSAPATSAPRTSGQVVTSLVAAAGTRERSSAITDSASWIGSSGCGTAASARDQVASQASCGRPVSTSDRRALVDLVLELLRDSHAAGGHGLAVEDRQVDADRSPCSAARPARSRPRRTPARAGPGEGDAPGPGSPAAGC